ncbi:MAG TPA: DUF2924 domain-containing protein [Planctomycetota bacterium]|jgi:hypothetical protein
MNIGNEIAMLEGMTVKELRRKHVELFGEDNRSRHQEYLVKRIAWRMQARAEGGLSEHARRRAMELAAESDFRTTKPERAVPPSALPGRIKTVTVHNSGDARIPMPGAVISRDYKGRQILVRVLPKGFEFEGELYRTLSAIAKVITGAHWNGYHFFGLECQKERA